MKILKITIHKKHCVTLDLILSAFIFMDDKKLEIDGAIIIQRLVRGFLQRKRFKKLKEMVDKRNENAREFLETEREYVNILKLSLKVYLHI